MDKPEINHPTANHVTGLQEVSVALFVMRDALTQLSLALKDWQFEHDHTQRENVRRITQNLLTSVTTTPKSKPDQAPLL